MAGKVKASELSVGDRVRVSIMGEEQDVELMQVEREESDGDEVVVFRFEVEGGVISRRVPPGEELDRAGS